MQQYKVGEPIKIEGTIEELRETFLELAVKLTAEGKSVLLVDTIRCMDPNHLAFSTSLQRALFRKLYCLRIDKPYALLYRLRSAGAFIRERKIDVIIITSINALFADPDESEAAALQSHIMENFSRLCGENGLLGIRGVLKK